jgi:uncharacterized membrane protein YbhN (UPF0104 family)
MFYNLFLPGGIGGDAYKGYRIKKDFGAPVRKVLSVLVLDRLSGLLILFVLACLMLFGLRLEMLEKYNALILFFVPISIMFFFIMTRRFFAYTLPVFWKSIGYSIGVQLAQLVCVFFILKALKIDDDILSYLLIFLASSIVSVLPLTLGGIGSREVTFYYGAELLQLQEARSIAISVTFFLITALISLMGIVYHFKKIALKDPKDDIKEVTD